MYASRDSSRGRATATTWNAIPSPRTTRTESLPRHASHSPNRNPPTANAMSSSPRIAAPCEDRPPRPNPWARPVSGATGSSPGSRGGEKGEGSIPARTATAATAAIDQATARSADSAGRDRLRLTSGDCSSEAGGARDRRSPRRRASHEPRGWPVSRVGRPPGGTGTGPPPRWSRRTAGRTGRRRSGATRTGRGGQCPGRRRCSRRTRPRRLPSRPFGLLRDQLGEVLGSRGKRAGHAPLDVPCAGVRSVVLPRLPGARGGPGHAVAVPGPGLRGTGGGTLAGLADPGVATRGQTLAGSPSWTTLDVGSLVPLRRVVQPRSWLAR